MRRIVHQLEHNVLLLDVAMRDNLSMQAAVVAIEIDRGLTNDVVGVSIRSRTYPSGSPVIFIFKSAYFVKT